MKKLNKINRPVLVKVPFINGLGKTKGCEISPDKIVNTIPEIWCNESLKPIKKTEEIFNIKKINVFNENASKSIEAIFNESKKIFSEKSKQKIIFLGGDHSISFPITNAFNSCFKNSAFIILDAHADCMKPIQEPTHEEWLRALIEKTKVNPRNIFIIGLRNIYKDELCFLKQKKIKYFTTKDFFENRNKIEKELKKFMKKFKNIYLSLDIDLIDPVFTPGISYEEPCGLTSREGLSLFQKIISNKNIKAIDINEVNSFNDSKNKTTKLATKFLCELI